MLSRRLFSAGAAAVFSGFFARPAHAMQVSPMVAQITPSGPRSSYRMSIRNDGATPITVEIQTFAMQVDDSGAQNLTEEPGDLLAFPPQSIIPPGREQLVNVRYVGDARIDTPRLYVVRAAQLPVALSAAEGGVETSADVKVAFNVNTHVFVSPPDAEPEIEVSSVARADNGDALISVYNSGGGVARLRTARYLIRDAGGREVEVPSSKVQLGQVSALPPKRTRTFRIAAADIPGLTGALTAIVRLE